MYRKAFHRPRSFEQSSRFRIPRDDGRSWPFERSGRFRIPQDDARSQFLEAMAMVAVLAVLTIVLGLVVGIPLAVMLNDICASIKC